MTKKTRLTHDIMLSYGFKQSDWFYNKGKFSVGFLFLREDDSVDIFYKDISMKFLPLKYAEDLEFLYKFATGKDLKK